MIIRRPPSDRHSRGRFAMGGGAQFVLSQYSATVLDDFTLTISGPETVGASSIQAFDNGVSLGTDNASPFTFAYVDITLGAHVIEVEVDGGPRKAAGTITVSAAASANDNAVICPLPFMLGAS